MKSVFASETSVEGLGLGLDSSLKTSHLASHSLASSSPEPYESRPTLPFAQSRGIYLGCWRKLFFVLACHYAISKLCKCMSHHNEVCHVCTRLHIHRFRPWAPVPLPGVCFLTNACGSPIAHFERFCSAAGWSCGTRA